VVGRIPAFRRHDVKVKASRPVLTKLLTKVIRSRRTLIEEVHTVFDKEDWVTQRKWREDNCIEDSEMLHYLIYHAILTKPGLTVW